ncbi:MAG: hypothetical protein GF315_05890 [candidate division Zixibacteria bacterium]|nr:hypothetical protein [candidate division Zixibacteria bacterium]
MSEKKPVYGNGVTKTSARDLVVLTDEQGATWICDAEEAAKVDRNRPFGEQNLKRCQVMPFDHGG